MKIEDFDATQDLSTPLEIQAALSKRSGAGLASFWLTHGGERFPMINIMINGDLAYVHYFPEDRHPGYASAGALPQLPPDGITHFFQHPTDEPFDIMNNAVVRASEALKVAQEFAVSKGMPKCIPWRSLIVE
jgi:hypothetical protein